MRVASKTNPKNLAYAVFSNLEEKGEVTLQGIGAGAVNQMVKAIILLKGIVGPQGKEITSEPLFCDAAVGDDVLTAIQYKIKYID